MVFNNLLKKFLLISISFATASAFMAMFEYLYILRFGNLTISVNYIILIAAILFYIIVKKGCEFIAEKYFFTNLYEEKQIISKNAYSFDDLNESNTKLKAEVKKATSDLRHANNKLKRLDEAKSEFISIASHQLRTPLTIIKGYISMLLDGNFGELNPIIKDPLEKVYESNERLINMVENLLNLTKIEADRLQLVFKEINLEYLTCDIVDEIKSNAEKKGLKLIYLAPDTVLPKIKIDEEKMRQVIINLIDNAIKYTKKGEIKVSVKSDGGSVKFCISDMGIGIRKEDQQNLFKKFSRGKNSLLINTEGTGLGLFIAKQMINAHSGKIWAESEGEGKGSNFYFNLPISKDNN
jgi:signal transduction histidine kinase